MLGLTHASRLSVCLTVGVLVFALPLRAQSNAAQQTWDPHRILREESFVKPPADVERIIRAARTDITFSAPSPDRKWFLRTPASDRGTIADYGKPHILLGGVQIDTRANRARSLTTGTRTGLVLVDPRTMATKTIETPRGERTFKIERLVS